MTEDTNPSKKGNETETSLISIAAQHGLHLQESTYLYNETGLDFQVIHALDDAQQP